jgi:PAS domain S-box-containing protein
MRSLDWMSISHPDDVQADLDKMARLNAGEVAGFQMEKRLVRPDGTVAWINLTVAPIQVEEHATSRHLAMIEDIATRKQAEEAMRESEQRFHTMADTAPVLIWMSGLDKSYTYFNQRWLDYTGRTLEQELGNSWAEGVYQEDVDRCLKTYGEAFDRREPFQMEYRLRKADGQYGWLLARGVPRLLQNGKFAGYIGICIDLTERKDLEDRLRKTVKEKESLLREVHHRVKNNLQVISSLLNLQAASIKDPQVVQLFRESQTRITSIALLHETLHRSNDLSCIRMSDYLGTLTGHVFRSYGVDPKAMVLDLLVEDLAFDIDTGMTCGMIVEELLSNALKHAYAAGKGGRIQIGLQAQDEGTYLLQVSDDGVGISKDGVRRNPASLGLELVNLLVEKLDGAVELQNGPGTAWRIAFHQLHYQERM